MMKKEINGKMEKFSVLMSIYTKEKPDNLRQCFDSLLNQTVKAAEWVIVEDGLLTTELYSVLDEYEQKYPTLLKRIPFKENRGLGLALRDGVISCSYNLIARMDTDDISREDRFERQLAMFNEDPTLDICSSHIKEFDENINNIISERKVPIFDREIKKYQRRRDAFNHMAVMYKKEAVIKAGNYQSCLLMEDTLLWVNMILSGAKCGNVDDYLVYARTGKDMFERRGGYSYFFKYKHGRKLVYNTGYISLWDYIYTLVIQFFFAIIPNDIRKILYQKFLRN